MLVGCVKRLCLPSRSPCLGAARQRLMAGAAKVYDFGPIPISEDHVFLTSDLTFAFVNLKPVVPGHVLISPKRKVKRFVELTKLEVGDLWCVAQRVGSTLEEYLRAESVTFAIQDGPAAGQTVPHVHVHCLPRRPGDFERNDDVYEEIDKSSKAINSERSPLDPENRKPRSSEEMAKEASEFRMLFS